MSVLTIGIFAVATLVVTRSRAAQLTSLSFLGATDNHRMHVTLPWSRNGSAAVSDASGRGNASDVAVRAPMRMRPIDDRGADDQISDDESDEGDADGNVDVDESDDDDDFGDEQGVFEAGKIEDDPVLSQLSPHIKDILTNKTKRIDDAQAPASPACRPHFRLALPDNRWDDATKFRRIYFYHARKAGGSSMHQYLAKVAAHYDIELKGVEWTGAEEPGTHVDNATFYVTHLREPVERSISHFKYQGRWDCKDLSFRWGKKDQEFEPTERNAQKLETWNQTMGHLPVKCKHKRMGGKRHSNFFLGNCAVNCYTQWFSGLSCPEWGIPVDRQYRVAKEKLRKYNLVVVIEKLKDPKYVRAIEDIFNVTGITAKGNPFCEKKSHAANARVPLVVRNGTRERLTRLNRVDIELYREMTDCLDAGRYDFPKWDVNRFELNTTNFWRAKAAKQAAKEAENKRKKAKNQRRKGVIPYEKPR